MPGTSINPTATPPRRLLQAPAPRPLGRLVMLLLLAALVLMFAASFAYRLSHPSLLKLSDRPENAAGETGEGALSAEAMRHISELMSRLAAEPQSYELRLELAEHFMDGAEWEKALAMLGVARQQHPEQAQICLYQAYCRFNLGDYAGAAADYEAALALAYDATAKVNLAYIYKNFMYLEEIADKMLDEVIKAPETEEDLRRAAVELRAAPPLRPAAN